MSFSIVILSLVTASCLKIWSILTDLSFFSLAESLGLTFFFVLAGGLVVVVVVDIVVVLAVVANVVS